MSDDITKRKADYDAYDAANVKQSRTVFDNLPRDNQIDDNLFMKPFNDLFDTIKEEFKETNIDVIVTRFKKITPVFYSISRTYRELNAEYNKVFTNFFDTLCSVYNINIDKLIYVQIGSIDYWGHVYWEFLHLASILLNNAFEMKKINYFLYFATIIYHIDLILPCSMCAAHYKTIKYLKPHVKYDIPGVMIKIAYGLPMVGLQIFHNIISRNINNSQENINRPRKPFFDMSDFAKTYKCILSFDEATNASTNYIESVIDWQPNTHYLLCIILAKYMTIPYNLVSDMLKTKLYSKSVAFTNFSFKLKYNSILDDHRQYDETIKAFFSLSNKQIKYLIVQALNLQFQHTSHTKLSVEGDGKFNTAIEDFYKTYPKFITSLNINKVAKY